MSGGDRLQSLPACTCALLLLLAHARPGLATGGSLPDARAVVGHVFKYALVASGEDGSQVQVTEANQDSLPSWLYYSPKSGSLKGVPGPADRGVYIIAVRGLSSSRSAAGDSSSDVFALSVVDEAGSVAVVAVPLRADDVTQTCRPRDTVTVAGVVVDADLASLSARQRVRLLTDLATSVGVHARHVAIFPTSSSSSSSSSATRAAAAHGGGWLPDAADKSVLVAGPGDVVVATAKVQTSAAWVVGCGAVSDDHVGLLEDVEKSAADGRLARAVGHGIVGWRVANRLPTAGADSAGRHRLRRQAGQTLTGVPTPQPPPSASIAGDLSRSAVVMTSATVTIATSSAAPIPAIRPTAVVTSPPATVTTPLPAQTVPPTTAATTTQATTTTTTTTTVVTSPMTTPAAVTSTARTQPPTTTVPPTTSSSARPATTTTTTASTAAVVVAVGTSPSSAERSTLRTSTKPSRVSPAVSSAVLPVTTTVSTSTAAAAATRGSMPVTSRAAPSTTGAPATSAAPAAATTTSGRATTVQPLLPARPTIPPLHALKPQITVTAQPERLLRFKLPADTFSEPLEDLRVAMLLPGGRPLPHSHWVTFRPADYEIVVLAARSHHHGEYLLGAVNVANRTAQTKVVVHVESPPPGAPDPAAGATQVYRLTIEADYDQLVSNVTAFESLVGALERLHQGRRVVITGLSRGSVVVSYAVLPDDNGDEPQPTAAAANESAGCDQQAAKMDNAQLFNSDGSMRNDVQRGMPFKILSLTSTPRAACQSVLQPMGAQPTAAAMTTTTHRQRTSKPPPRARVDSLVLLAERGKELRYEVPDDLFVDEEDGNTKYLKLLLRSVDSGSTHPTATDVSASAPLQLHQWRGSARRAVLQGLFWEQPSRSTAHHYQLVASNRHGSIAVVHLQLNVTEPPAPPVFVLRAKLGVDYSLFANNVTRQLELLQRVALRLYGDASTAHFSLLDVRSSDGKTLVAWTNTSVSSAAAGSCPIGAIAAVARVVMHNKTIAAAAMDKKTGLGQFDVVSLHLEPRGVCVGKVHTQTALPPVPGAHVEVGKTAEEDADSFWLTVVVPVIVIIVLLVVAIIVAAVLISRRRRSTRANVSGGGGANGTFIGKTVPVIFDEEREDGGGGAACRTPLMHEDKPVGPPPPDYPNLYGGVAYPEQKQPLMSSAAQQADGSPGGGDAMPPYQPPTPPVSEPDETSTFPRAGAASASIGARSQQQNFVPP